MSRLVAFLVAFLVALAAALVPLAASDLPQPGGQYAAEARQPGPTPPDVEAGSLVYEHIVYPGIQGERANSYLYLRNGTSKSGTALHENNDSGKWQDARISESLPAEQKYTIEATTLEAGETGLFELTICRSADKNGVCYGEILELSPSECTADLGELNQSVRISGEWTEACPRSTVATEKHARYYIFYLPKKFMNQDKSIAVHIDLRGEPDIKGNPIKLDLTCGWHWICHYATVAKHYPAGVAPHWRQSGIDIDGDAGDPVFLAIEFSGDEEIKALPKYITDDACKKIEIEIVAQGSNSQRSLGHLRYTHTVIPSLTMDGIFHLPLVTVSSKKGTITVRQIGQIAKIGGGDGASDNPKPQCTNEGTHLHQGYDHTNPDIKERYVSGRSFFTRNVDPDIDDAGRIGCITEQVDDRGFYTRKVNKIMRGGNCLTTTGINNGTGCFWSDVWVLAIGPTAPEPSDRNVDGPSEIYGLCPTRTLTLSASDKGGEVSPEPPAPGDPSLTYRPGIAVTLTATPGADYYTHWTERGGINVKEDSVVVRMNRDRRIAANFVPHGTLENLLVRSSGRELGVPFRSRHAARFELYTSSDSSCRPGTSGCTLAATVTMGAAASDAKRDASFGDHPTSTYWVRGQYCASGSASGSGSGGASGAAATTGTRVATDACGAWSALSPSSDHTAPTATPTPTYRLTVEASPSSCGNARGTGDYAQGEEAAISASVKANSGCHFKNWTGAGIENSSSSSTTVTMGAAPMTVTANFTRQCMLTVQVGAGGGGTTTPAAKKHLYRDCPPSVELEADPDSGYRFGSWSGSDIASASSSSTSVTMSAGDDKTVTASFVLIPPTSCKLTVDVSPSGSGTTRPAAGSAHTYDPCKSSVGLEADAGTGYRFDRWSGNDIASTSSNPATVAMKAGDDKTVTAHFVHTSCTLTVRVSPIGGGTTTPAVGTYPYTPCRTSVQLKADANPGYRFVRWDGASGTSAKTSVALKDGDSKTVTARFAKQCTLTATSSPGGTVSGGGTFDCYTWKLLTATVTTGSSFARWTGDLSGSRNPDWIYLRTDKNVHAVFRCRVTVTAGAGGSVTGNGNPDCGTFWWVRASHNDYHYLKRWVGDSRTSSRLRLYLVGNKTLRAVFDHVCNHPVYGAFCPVAGAEDESGAEP